MKSEIDVVRQLFSAVADRDLERLLDCYGTDICIREDDALPYGGLYHGPAGATQHAAAFLATWGRFQQGLTYAMEPRYLGDGRGTVVVLFRHRAWNAQAARLLDTPEVGVYQVADRHIHASQMIHLDVGSLLSFLAEAAEPVTTPGGRDSLAGRRP